MVMYKEVAILFIVVAQCLSSLNAKRTKKPINYGLCTADQYRCQNNRCIQKRLFCNNINDCGDNSDETYCSRDIYRNGCPSHYPFFQCGKAGPYNRNSRCIPAVWKCDGFKDCPTGSDELNCLDDVENINGVIDARKKATQWLKGLRRNNTGNERWGYDAPRIAIALHMTDPNFFNGSNAIGNEIAYEIDNLVLTDILRNLTDPMPLTQLAIYIHALLVTCIDPRNFHGINLISELRQMVNSHSRYVSPLAVLALCNANERMASNDVIKVVNAFSFEQLHFWKSNQALALMALSCIAENSGSAEMYSRFIHSMSSKIKTGQHNNGSYENLYTTALVAQAIFASGKEDGGWDMDEAVKFLVKSQNNDGSFGNFFNTYYTLPVLHYKSLLNISSSHCKAKSMDNATQVFDNLRNKIGKKIWVKYSLWFGDQLDLVRSLVIRVIENNTFFDIMNMAKSLDDKFNFKYNLLGSKPFVYLLGGYQDDPESEKFWFLYKVNGTGFNHEIIKSSPIDVIPKDKEEYVMWYRRGHWTHRNYEALPDNNTTIDEIEDSGEGNFTTFKT